MSNHIIHKQEVILNVESIDNAFDYQHTVSKLFANGLTIAIEEALNEIDTPGTITRIEKLNIDLGEVSGADFANGFKRKLIQQLRESLSSLHNEKIADVSVTKQAQSVREGFIYFIEKGILPWYIEAKNLEALEAVIFKEWIEKDWQLLIDWLRENIKNKPVIIERLALQCSQKFINEIVVGATHSSIEYHEWELLVNDLKLIYNRIAVSEILTTSFAEPAGHVIDMLELLFNQNRSFTLDELTAVQLHKIFLEKDKIKLNELTALLNSLRAKPVITIIENISLLYKNQVALSHINHEDLLRTDKNWLNGLSSVESHPSTTSQGLVNRDKQKPEEEKAIRKTSKRIKDTVVEDALFVDNCGVILLHPFLLSYFESLRIAENKKFISEETQKKAIILLYYLCTGLTEVAEFNLVLQKILCGFDIEETLPAELILSQVEIDESKELLQSVINYWPPVKNTSIEGLQQTFLQRKGKLITTDTGWQLTVEQKTVDILLNKLPWGFSTVKLPWMTGFLNVEWC